MTSKALLLIIIRNLKGILCALELYVKTVDDNLPAQPGVNLVPPLSRTSESKGSPEIHRRTNDTKRTS